MAYTIAFFGSKPYDEASFNEKNSGYGFELRYYKGHLNLNNVILTQGVDAVCIFVNDTADAEVIRQLAANGVKLLALRCAGYNKCRPESGSGKRHHRGARPRLLPLRGSGIHRCPHALPQPEDTPRHLAHTRRQLLPARPFGIRHVWQNGRYHRHR